MLLDCGGVDTTFTHSSIHEKPSDPRLLRLTDSYGRTNHPNSLTEAKEGVAGPLHAAGRGDRRVSFIVFHLETCIDCMCFFATFLGSLFGDSVKVIKTVVEAVGVWVYTFVGSYRDFDASYDLDVNSCRDYGHVLDFMRIQNLSWFLPNIKYGRFGRLQPPKWPKFDPKLRLPLNVDSATTNVKDNPNQNVLERCRFPNGRWATSKHVCSNAAIINCCRKYLPIIIERAQLAPDLAKIIKTEKAVL